MADNPSIYQSNKELRVDKYLKYDPPNVEEIFNKFKNRGEKPIEINFTRKPFPEIYVMAQFSSNVYKNLHQEKVAPPDGWTQLVTGRNDENNYYGAVFLNVQDQQIVIAHRGTTMTMGSLKADIKSIVNNNISAHMLSAITFAAGIIKFLPLPGYSGNYYQVSTTGHSLGGWLAHVTTFTAKYFKKHEREDVFVKDENFHKNYHVHAVTFDNPGCFEMLHKLKNDTSPRYEESGYGDANVLDINSYLSAPNRINSCNKHTGQLFRTFPDIEKGSVPIKDNYNLITHRMQNILNYLKDTDHEKVLKVIEDWPHKKPSFSFFNFFSFSKTGEYNQLFTELKHDNDYHVENSLSSIRYKAERDIKHDSFSLRMLTIEEQSFLSNLNCLKEDEKNCDKISDDFKVLHDFLFKNKHAKRVIEFLLLRMNYVMEQGRITCQENASGDLSKVLSVTKQLLFHTTTAVDQIMQQVKENPSANQKFWKVLSKQYVQSFDKFKGFKFRDTLGVHDFMASENTVYHIESNNGESEMERLYDIIDRDDSNIFLSWKRIQHIDKKNVIESLYNHKLIIIHVDTKEKEFKQIVSKITKNKAIIVCPHSWPLDKAEEDNGEGVLRETVRPDKITIGDLTDTSKAELMSMDMVFQGRIKQKLKDLIAHADPEVQGKREKFVNEQNLEGFTHALEPLVHIGQDLSSYSCLALRFSKVCKDVEHVENVFGFMQNSTSADKFLITGIAEKDFDTSFAKYLTNIDRSKLILHSNEHIDGAEFFQNICKEDMNKSGSESCTIFWLHISQSPNDKTKKITWEQVYNTKFYIRRKLVKKQILNKGFVKFLIKDPKQMVRRETFKVIGGKENFEDYLQEQHVDKSILQKYTELHNIIFEGDKNGAEPVEKPIHTIHVIKEDKLKCIWLETEGSIRSINSKIPMIENDYDNLLDERNLDSILSQRIVILADEPGMGKTTLLTSLSEQLVSKGEWLLKIDLNTFKSSTIKYADDGFQGIIRYLQESIGDEFRKSFTINMLTEDMKSSLFKQVYFLMDGFDEIREKDSQMNIIKIIKYLKQYTAINCWISTRTYTKDILETELSLFGISILEISEKEQKDYLIRVWKTGFSFDEKKIDEEFYVKQADNTLEQAKKLFGNDAKRFVGNPLHLRLMADSLQPDISRYSNKEDTPVYLDSIFKLYQKFLTNKYEIYFREKSDVRTELRSLLKAHIHTKFQEIAFKSRFPKEGEDFFGNKGIPDELVEELHRIGLVRTKNNTIKVFHETFVDYYCATLIVDWLDSHANSPPIDSFLITKIFMKEDYTYIRHFINGQPMDNTKKIPIEFIWKTEEELFYNDRQETLFHVLVDEEQNNILKYAFDCCKVSHLGLVTPKVLSVRNVAGETPLFIAAKRGNDDILDQILVEMNDTCFKDGIEEILLATMFRCPEDGGDESIKKLRSAIEKSDYKFVKDVLNDLITSNYWRVIDSFIQTLRKDDCTLQDVKDHLHEMKTELQRKYLLLGRNSSWKTALHIIAYEGNLEIIKYLHAAGAELEVYDKMKRTPLQNAVESKNLKAVQYLVEKGHCVLAKDETEMDALLKAAKLGCLDILKYLIERGADVNAQDKCNINALLHAAKMGHLEVVKYLVEVKKMNIQHRDCYHITALSWAAQNKNNFNVVKYIVEEARGDLNSRDRNGMTPLHHAAKKQNQKIVEYLLEQGSDVNIPDRNKTTVLQRIIRWTGRKWDFVEKIIHLYEINYNICDDKYTPLQKALQDNRTYIVKHMIAGGAKTEYLTEEENKKLRDVLESE